MLVGWIVPVKIVELESGNRGTNPHENVTIDGVGSVGEMNPSSGSGWEGMGSEAAVMESVQSLTSPTPHGTFPSSMVILMHAVVSEINVDSTDITMVDAMEEDTSADRAAEEKEIPVIQFDENLAVDMHMDPVPQIE